MRLGLIARGDLTGVGHQTREFARHMNPAKVMLLDFCDTSPKGLTLHPEWYDDPVIVKGAPTPADIDLFLRDLDVVFTVETPYNHTLFHAARHRGIRTYLQYNWEMLGHLEDPFLPQPDLFLAPSTWHLVDFPFGNVEHLPVPIALDRFIPRKVAKTATNFLHVVGHSAAHDRNGTQDLLSALQYVTSEVTLTLCAQGEFPELPELKDNVSVVLKSPEANYWDLYTDQDVLVMPRRYGGLSLPTNEALGAGMPVIMPNTIPNNQWLPEEWLVPAQRVSHFKAKTQIDVYSAFPFNLAVMIDRFATNSAFYRDGVAHARFLAYELSWEQMKPRYDKVLSQ